MTVRKNKKNILLRFSWLVPLVFSCLIALASPSICRAENPPIYWKPQIEIPIVGNRYLDFQADKGIPVNGELLGNYISAIYVYATGVVGILAVVVLMVAGFIRLTAGGDAGRVKQANEYVSGAITGILLLFFSYTILELVNPDLVQLKNLDIAEVKSNNKTSNSANIIRIQRDTTPLERSAAVKAKRILDEKVGSRIVLSTDADCGGNYNAQGTMRLVASNEGRAIACDANCNCQQETSVNLKVLVAVDKISDKRNLTITSITTGRHAVDSDHYKGNAVDFVPTVNNNETQNEVWNNIVTELNTNNGFEAFCDKGGKKVTCDKADHIHLSVDK